MLVSSTVLLGLLGVSSPDFLSLLLVGGVTGLGVTDGVVWLAWLL
ncbi:MULTISPECIES: hypothetical protein [Moraxella]|nr:MULTISPECIES: hypothetical protein [Moraxella]MDH9218556.1 hypothetical protein [Moraxella lacunata]